MIIPLISKINNKPVVLKPSTLKINFRGNLKNDVFETKSIKTKIKDLNGNDIQAIIIETEPDEEFGLNGANPKLFFLYIKGEKIGYASVYDSSLGDSLQVRELYTQEHNEREFKGVGTELLKTVIKESIKRGYNGRLSGLASHYPPPFVFYYKNNFLVTGKKTNANAAIDYCTRYNLPIKNFLQNSIISLPIELDEKGAKAVLEDRRLFNKREYKELLNGNIEGADYVATLTKFPQLKQDFIQVINKDASSNAQVFVAKVKKEKSIVGYEFLRVYDIESMYIDKEEKDFAQKAAQIAAYEYGLEKAIFELS